AARPRYLLHHGRADSCSAGDRYRRRPAQSHQRAQSSVTPARIGTTSLDSKGMTMIQLHITAFAAAIALAFSAGALAAQGMSKQEYKAGQDRIAADYKSAKAACDSLSANAKDVCMAEARGKQKVAKAELEATNKPGDKARY